MSLINNPDIIEDFAKLYNTWVFLVTKGGKVKIIWEAVADFTRARIPHTLIWLFYGDIVIKPEPDINKVCPPTKEDVTGLAVGEFVQGLVKIDGVTTE